jgi:hypothetical protein
MKRLVTYVTYLHQCAGLPASVFADVVEGDLVEWLIEQNACEHTRIVILYVLPVTHTQATRLEPLLEFDGQGFTIGTEPMDDPPLE